MPTVTQLEYVLAVHRSGHFGKAALACHVAQPTLSAQIQKAEEELGIQIFVRQNKPVTATEKGYALIEQAQVVVAAHERLVRMAKGQFETIAGELALGIIPTLAPYVIPWFLQSFATRNPLVNVTIVERTTEEILADLKRRRLDVGLVATPLREARTRERTLFYDPFYLYAAPGEAVLDLEEVAPSDIDPAKLWILEDGHCVRHQTLTFCDLIEGCSHLSTVRFEAGSFETLRHLIDASEGYTLIPETYARLLPSDRRRAQVRPFADPTPTREIGLIHLESSWKTDLIGALEASIRATIPRSLRRTGPSPSVLPARGAGEPRPAPTPKKRTKVPRSKPRVPPRRPAAGRAPARRPSAGD